MRRQELNVFRMRLMGAKVIPVTSGTRTLKDATTEAIRDWVTNVEDTHYIIGSVVGPAPYPRMVREFQAVIGREAASADARRDGRAAGHGRRLRRAAARTRWASSPGSWTIADVELVGVEAAGDGLDTERHSASLSRGTPGVLHGSLSYLLQDAVRAGAPRPLDLGGAGLSRASDPSTRTSRTPAARRTSRSPISEALSGFALLSRLEGIIPALETAHAVAWIDGQNGRWSPDQRVLLCVSGRGDKDVAQISQLSTLPE